MTSGFPPEALPMGLKSINVSLNILPVISPVKSIPPSMPMTLATRASSASINFWFKKCTLPTMSIKF